MAPGRQKGPEKRLRSPKGVQILCVLEMLFSESLCKVEIGDSVCYVIPSGSGYFIRFHLVMPKGFSSFEGREIYENYVQH